MSNDTKRNDGLLDLRAPIADVELRSIAGGGMASSSTITFHILFGACDSGECPPLLRRR